MSFTFRRPIKTIKSNMFSPFMYVEKWPNTALFLTYVWPFFKIMLERVKEIFVKIFLQKETVSYKFKRTHTVEYSIIHSTKLDSLTSNCLDSLTRICAIWTDKNHYIYLPNILNCSSNNVFPEDDVTANPF